MEKTKMTISPIRATKEDSMEIAALHSPATFQALLRHERCRSDRDGGEFSLAVFNVSALVSDSRGMKQIARGIREKMRSIDEIGWLDERNIGVLLPVTNLQGGQRFAARVSDSARMPSSSISWTVHSYPAHWPAGGNGGSHDEPWYLAFLGDLAKPQQKENEAEVSRVAELIRKIFSRKIPYWKRAMDVVGSLLFIVLLSPLFMFLAFYIKCSSPGKILFKQKRVGYQRRLFTFLKFRTMHENNYPCSHKDYLKELIRDGVPMEKLDYAGDPRIIPGGKVLRKACLDELPQLFNVLCGEMSLVGPRPCIPYEADEYLRWHTHRFDILPGMTGLWQVGGKNKLSFDQMIRLDISYASKMSPFLDLKILFLTVPTIIGLVFEAGVKKLRGTSPVRENVCEDSERGSLGNA